MKHTNKLVLAGVLCSALALSACGSDSEDAGTDTGSEAGKIGVILYIKRSSVRWENAVRPAL